MGRRHRASITLPVPPERAFAMLVEPSSIRGFWGAARAVVAPEVGGTWAVAWGEREDAPDYLTIATIAVFEAPRRLRLTDFRYRGPAGELPFDTRPMATEFTIVPSDHGCWLTVVQDGFPDAVEAEDFFAACERGWKTTLESLQAFAGGAPERAAAAPARVAAVVPTLETERLRMRAFRTADIGAYAALCADAEVMQFLGGRPFSRTESWRQVAMMIGHWELRGFGMWAVERRSDGALIGRVGCLEPDGWPDFEVGWMLGRQFWGAGYATEAARAAMAWARGVLGVDRIVHLIVDDNARSAAVATRLGATPGERASVLGYDVVVWQSRRTGA